MAPSDPTKADVVEVGPAPPPAQQQSVDEVVELLNKTPLFMTELDETDAEGGQNTELEALKALAYEGTKAEIADNFKSQGNDCVKMKQWSNAREFYGRAIALLKGEDGNAPSDSKTNAQQTQWFGEEERKVVDLDDEAAKEKKIEEACYVNRALCNLELKNYGSCNRDCAAALSLNPRNVKAYYRSGSACFALDKLSAAADACERALALDPDNAAVKNLIAKIQSRVDAKAKADKQKFDRLQRQKEEARTMQKALQDRNITVKWTNEAPADVEDAKFTLDDPFDSASALTMPVLLMYPTAAQTDLIKAFGETEALTQHFDYIFPCPWDVEGEFTAQRVECYIDTVSGGLIKVGKKVAVGTALGKAEIRDGLVRIYVVPKTKVDAWIAEFKRRKNR